MVCFHFLQENNDEEAKDEEKVTQDEDESARKTEHGTVDVQEMEGVKDTAGVSDDTKKEVKSGIWVFPDVLL